MNFEMPNFSTAVEKQTTKSVMSPMLWLAGIVLLPVVPAAVFTVGFPQTVFLSILVAMVTVAVGVYLYWTFKDPERLQSEEYQIQRQKLQLLGDDRHPGAVIDIEVDRQTSNTHVVTASGAE